jgi:gluconolactonase
MFRLPLLALLLPLASSAASPVIADRAKLTKLAGEYSFTEGPATDAKGDVFFTDQPNDRIVKWSAGDGSVVDWMKPADRTGCISTPDGTCSPARTRRTSSGRSRRTRR